MRYLQREIQIIRDRKTGEKYKEHSLSEREITQEEFMQEIHIIADILVGIDKEIQTKEIA